VRTCGDSELYQGDCRVTDMLGFFVLMAIPMSLYGLTVLFAKACTANARAAKARKRMQRAEEAKYLKW
jgi:hypothetical protein